MARECPNSLARLHALWTLEGLNTLRPEAIVTAFADVEPKVRANAMRLAMPLLNSDPSLRSHLVALANDPATEVRTHLLLALGECRGAETDRVMAEILASLSDNVLARSAALSGMKERELEFLQTLLDLPEFREESSGRAKIIELLAHCVLEDGVPARIGALLELVSADSRSAWHQVAILKAIAERSRPVRVPAEPPGLARRAAFESARVREIATKAAANFVWPGHPNWAEEARSSAVHSRGGDVCRR